MKTEIKPQDTSRAQAFELWMSSPMPMVTLTKTLDITRLVKFCKRNRLSRPAAEDRLRGWPVAASGRRTGSHARIAAHPILQLNADAILSRSCEPAVLKRIKGSPIDAKTASFIVSRALCSEPLL